MGRIEEFNQYLDTIRKRHAELNKELSEYDLEQEDILHFLELETYDAVTMVKVSKRLKEIRQKRREIKNELSMIQAIHARIGNNNLKYTTPNTYSFRTDILNDLVKKKKIVTSPDAK